MSKSSIYEDRWINMVFEGKNQEYGAYQLRQEGNKTMLTAFMVSLLFVASIVSIPLLINYFALRNNPGVILPESTDVIIQVSNYQHPPQKKPEKITLPISKKTETTDVKKEQLVNPEIVKPVDANDNIATNKENNIPNIETPTESTAIVGTGTFPSTGTETPAIADTGTRINTTNILDKLPEFPGGIKKFYTYVGNNFEKPEFDEVKTVRIYVAFVIEKDGSMTDIQVKRDPGYGLGEEAVRVLKSLRTKWAPGMIDGKPVRTAYNLPIVVEMK